MRIRRTKFPLLGIFVFGLLSVLQSTVAERLIGEGDFWRYYKGSSTPPLQSGVNWTQLGFSDGGWGPLSPSGFGYGDNDDATTFADMQNNYRSVFLRRNFTVPSPAAVTRLTLAVDYDDGFVAYINGIEVARRNMPSGAIDHSAFASTAHEASRGGGGENPQEKEFIAINPAVLASGNNVLAISGHNSSSGSTDFTLIPELYSDVTLVRGPFLQMPNPGQISVVWRTDALTDSAVDYGTDLNYSSGSVSDPALAREHVVTLPALPANATIFYRVRSGGLTLAESTLQTPRTADQPFRFSIYGDFGWSGAPGAIASSPTIAVAAQVNTSNPHFTLTVGDNIYDEGLPGLFDPSWFVPYDAINRRVPLFPSLGNHDVNNATKGSYYLANFYLPQNGPAAYRERNYSFDYGNAHFAMVDSNPFEENDAVGMAAIRSWLESDLAATAQRWKFVAFHHPPYTSDGGGAHGDNENMKSQLVPLFAQYGVQFVFQGHNHFYERINAINGVNYLTTGGGGRSLYAPSNQKEYSAQITAGEFSFTTVDINGGRLTLRQISSTGSIIDTFDLDLDHPFHIDGLIDDTSWLRAQNGLKLYAAIRGNRLYVATQDAGEGSDHFIYVNDKAEAMRATNWSKAGQVMQWGVFLADENDNGFQGWFDSAGVQITTPTRIRSMTSGLNNNSPLGDGVLEGTLDLPAEFGSFPAQLYLAAAPFGTANGGGLVSASQVPAGNGDGNIQPEEFLVLSTRNLALDLPTSDAGPNQSTEAGMRVTLSGTGTAPSGLPLSLNWTQLSGLVVAINQSNQSTAHFTATENVAQATDLTFRLRVNDTRFDTDSQTTVHLYPMIDTDNDGLSDQEELTGANNILTAANPAGRLTNPKNPDTDGDGMKDGDEAMAGTDPNSAQSNFRISSTTPINGSLSISWPSIPGRRYQLQMRSALAAVWDDFGAPVNAQQTTASTEVPMPAEPLRFYRVRTVPSD